jgi:hypothetical protein
MVGFELEGPCALTEEAGLPEADITARRAAGAEATSAGA